MEASLIQYQKRHAAEKTKNNNAQRRETMASGFSAEQLLALDDQSLAQYLMNNWGPRQVLDIGAIVDWSTTPEPLQVELIQRFKLSQFHLSYCNPPICISESYIHPFIFF